MMMRNENDAHVAHVEPGFSDAASHTIASIDHVQGAIDDQQV